MQKGSQQLCSPEWRSGGTGSSHGPRDGRCGSRVGVVMSKKKEIWQLCMVTM